MTVPLPEQSEINICYLELKNENKSVSILEVQPKNIILYMLLLCNTSSMPLILSFIAIL